MSKNLNVWISSTRGTNTASHSMSNNSVTRAFVRRQSPLLLRSPRLRPAPRVRCTCHYEYQGTRRFSSSPRPQSDYQESFGTRLRKALRETKIKWYPIPVGVGIGFLGLAQAYRVNEREKRRRAEEEWDDDGFVRMSGGENGNGEPGGRPRRRERIRPTGPW